LELVAVSAAVVIANVIIVSLTLTLALVSVPVTVAWNIFFLELVVAVICGIFYSGVNLTA
jgi:hypothetical protein